MGSGVLLCCSQLKLTGFRQPLALYKPSLNPSLPNPCQYTVYGQLYWVSTQHSQWSLQNLQMIKCMYLIQLNSSLHSITNSQVFNAFQEPLGYSWLIFRCWSEEDVGLFQILWVICQSLEGNGECLRWHRAPIHWFNGTDSICLPTCRHLVPSAMS